MTGSGWAGPPCDHDRPFRGGARWLNRCSERRPDDLAVRQAWLDLAAATNDAAAFQKAASHLPGSEFDAVSVLKFRTWLIGSDWRL